MVMTRNGHFTAHFWQPVQAATSINVEALRHPVRSSVNTCSGQAATHQPHPVQRAVSMLGNHFALRRYAGRTSDSGA